MDKQSLLSDTPVNLLKKFRKVLEANHIPFEKLILFGSFAKNTQHEASDVDVCVVSKDFGKDAFAEMVLLSKYAAQVDSMIEPHPYTPQDLASRWDPLATEIRNTGLQVD